MTSDVGIFPTAGHYDKSLLLKFLRSSFESLRTNGGAVEIEDFRSGELFEP